MTTERFEVQRTIPAEPKKIFQLLCDPHGHVAVWKERGIFPILSEGALRATLGILARTVARGWYPTPR